MAPILEEVGVLGIGIQTVIKFTMVGANPALVVAVAMVVLEVGVLETMKKPVKMVVEGGGGYSGGGGGGKDNGGGGGGSYNGDEIVENVPESSRSYSSIWTNSPVGTGYARSQLDSAQAWSAGTSGTGNNGEWMRMDLGATKMWWAS